MDFASKYGPWALIAGASEGTGASFARQLAAKGLNLFLVARREAPLAALADEIRDSYGVECAYACLDLSAPNAAGELSRAATGHEIGLLLYNVGADPNGSMFLDNDISNWNALAMRNVNCMMQACHEYGWHMRGRGCGGILVVGSGACYAGLPGIAVYGATKAFELVLCESLWAELRPHGVDVLHYVIGRTDTPAHRELMEARGMPIPDDLADPDEVAAIGIAHIDKGPVKNWDLADDEAGWAGISAADRRARIEAIAAMSAAYAAKGSGQ